MADRVSIRDLARLAGVSPATVSLALRDSREIAAATRARIQALARKHDYRSHPVLSTMMRQVGRGIRLHDEEVIALIRSGIEADERAPGQIELLAGASEEAHRLGYKLEAFWAGYKAANSRSLARVLYHRGIRGVIWSTIPTPHPQVDFPWERFVPIACSLSPLVPRLPTVTTHHVNSMATALQELTARGARRIGFLGLYSEDFRQNFGWSNGVHLYRLQGGAATVIPLLTPDDLDWLAIRAWINSERIDTLIATHGMVEGIADIAPGLPFASLDIPTSELGRLGGLYQDTAGIGRHTVRSLSLRLVHGITGLPEESFSVLTEAIFVDGPSLHPTKTPRARKPRSKAKSASKRV